ncbi:hypothetical protein Tco_0905658 [Tanacetum coccineum]
MEWKYSEQCVVKASHAQNTGRIKMWEIRIKQYFQIQDVWWAPQGRSLENGNSWVPIPVIARETGPSTASKMTVPSTAEKERCLDFGGNEATKKTQKAMLKQHSSKAVKYWKYASEKAMCAIEWCLNLIGVTCKGENQANIALRQSQILRSVGHKEHQMGLLRTELEKVKQEKEGFEFKIAKFKNQQRHRSVVSKSITDKSKRVWIKILKPTTGCDKESDNSKENTDDSLKQRQKTDSKTSYVKSPLKVDKDWKEKFFCPANHVREEEPKKARENNDALIIEDWVSDDEDEVEPIPKSNSQLNDKGFVDSGCSRHMTGNIAHLSDFKDFDGGYVTFGEGAYGGRINTASHN